MHKKGIENGKIIANDVVDKTKNIVINMTINIE
jgi:hypothetical protein